MEDLSGGDVRVDARLVVEHLRTILEQIPVEHPRGWTPQVTLDEFLARTDREPIHLHPSIHHLHRHWNMENLSPVIPKGQGRGLRARVRRHFRGMLEDELRGYLGREQDFRGALAQSIDALAYRADEMANADYRHLIELIRADLLSLTRYLEQRIEAGPSGAAGASESEH